MNQKILILCFKYIFADIQFSFVKKFQNLKYTGVIFLNMDIYQYLLPKLRDFC